MRGTRLLWVAVGALAVAASVATGCGGEGASVGIEPDADTEGGGSGNNPPGCPASAPTDRAPCALAAGLRCEYGCGQGGPSSATCNGTWAVLRSNIACVVADAATEAPPPADGPFACGASTCAATSYCIQPCCGGAGPPCIAKPDGGKCPNGSHPEYCEPDFGGQAGDNCRQDPCTPPAPYCTDDAGLPPGCILDSNGSRKVVCACA